MQRPNSKIFLERRSYRLRRLIDAVRILPILGFLLFLSPLLVMNSAGVEAPLTASSAATSSTASTARVGLFIFAAWGGLIVAAAWLSRHVGRGEDPAYEQNSKPDDPL